MHKNRLLIVGCGDVMRRALPWLTRRFRVYALSRSAATAADLRALGVVPITGDLDQPHTLRRLAGLATYVLHSAPPPAAGADDPRTRRLLAALSNTGILPRGVVYISTSGVYGDCQGNWVAETRPLQAESDRARRRVAAEACMRKFGGHHARVSILRAPGIYAADRLPVDRLRAGTPALIDADDGYSNHIHADDLAYAACLALFRGRHNRVYNVNDDCQWKMGEWFDRVADTYGLPRPARLAREAMQQAVSPALWSFMRESRRLDNTRLKRELGMRLQYETPAVLLAALKDAN
ncbi:MAG: SDR family NAD(P)-dependent oxidoreductase [Burkholderiales bacterium]|nr:SDR family NAD(P)-dependent oxidoreductase [Burkholderiales bacterium]